MTQLGWMFGLLPDAFLNWFYWAIIVAGITGVLAGWLGKWIPFYGNYVKILQPVGIVLLVLGVWLRGGYDTEMAWREKVKAAEERVALAEKQAEEANGKVEVKIVETTKVIKEKGNDIIKYVDREVVKKEEIIKYIERCPVPTEIINLHNQATELNRAAEGAKK